MSKFRNQILCAICVNITSLAYGLAVGWCSYTGPLIISDDSPLKGGPATVEQMSWIASIFCIGGAVGSFIFGFIADEIGRKNALLVCGVCQVVGWAINLYTFDVSLLYVARFISGLSCGGAYVTVPVYITEVSDKTIRGRLGTFMVLSTMLGTLIGYIIGAFFGSLMISAFGLVMAVFFIIWMSFIPETPIYLCIHNKTDAAQISLKYYHHDLTVEELCKSKDSSKTTGITWTDICVPTTRRAIIIGFIVLFVGQFSGAFLIANYASTIFRDAGAILHPDQCAVIVGILQLLGSYAPTLLIEKQGRKILLTSSALGSAVFLFLMGAYAYYKHLGYDVSEFTWVPLISLSAMIFISSAGVRTVPYIVAAEILPQKLRGPFVGFLIVFVWLTGFAFLKYFPLALELIQLHGCMWFFGICCMFYTIFILICLPETKGKTYEEIRVLFAKKSDLAEK